MGEVEKLNFPVIKGLSPSPRWMTMDDYLKFVTFNWKYIVDKEACRDFKKKQIVNAAFYLK